MVDLLFSVSVEVDIEKADIEIVDNETAEIQILIQLMSRYLIEIAKTEITDNEIPVLGVVYVEILRTEIDDFDITDTEMDDNGIDDNAIAYTEIVDINFT